MCIRDRVIDNKWMAHLDDMDALREGIGLQAYGQRDPVVEYKMQGYEMYESMMASIQEETIRILFHIRVEQKVEREAAAKVTGTNKDASAPVSYTHLDVYKRQILACAGKKRLPCNGIASFWTLPHHTSLCGEHGAQNITGR